MKPILHNKCDILRPRQRNCRTAKKRKEVLISDYHTYVSSLQPPDELGGRRIQHYSSNNSSFSAFQRTRGKSCYERNFYRTTELTISAGREKSEAQKVLFNVSLCISWILVYCVEVMLMKWSRVEESKIETLREIFRIDVPY